MIQRNFAASSSQSSPITGATLVQFIAAVFSVTVGVLHLVLTPEHAQEVPAWGVFFALAGMAQIASGFALLLWNNRWLYVASALVNVLLVAIFIITRIVPAPLSPTGHPEEVEFIGLFTVIVESVLAIALAYLLPLRWKLVSVLALVTFVGVGASCSALNILIEQKTSRAPVPALAAPLSPRAGGQVREFHLTASQINYEFVAGQRTTAWALNGQIPGPEIRVREGDLVRVVLTNNLPEPTTLHWHGVNVTTNMDGVPNISQSPVPPGGTFTYEFIASPSGTRWYHAHFDEPKQLRLGLYAPLIIEPAEPEQTHYDRDYTVVLSEWSPDALTYDMNNLNKSNGGMGGMMNGMMGGNMMMSAPDDPNVKFMVNGKGFPAAEPLVVREGERVRLRLINGSGVQKHIIRLDGHTLKITHTDGNPLPTPREVDAIEIGPGERYDVEVIANQPGVWALHCLRDGHAERGLETLVRYEAVPFDGRANTDTRASRDFKIWPDSVLALPASPSESTRPDKQFELTLSGGMMMGGMMGGMTLAPHASAGVGGTNDANTWTINGKSYPNTDPLFVKQGDHIRVRLFNMSMEDHPMHLHGHTFTVLQYDGRPIAPMLRDTLNVRRMESYDIEFVADNPGTWFFHCHNADHMAGGLITLVKYQ